MERLWAPWRSAYVTGSSGESIDCIFCHTADPDRDELMLFRGRVCFVILNLYPYTNGHLMVVPYRHASNLATLSADEQAELMRLTRHAEMALNEAYAPHGINVGINLGKAAGAGVPGHLHVHLVPRWTGDTNFMTAVADTRVLPEEFSETARKLRPIFERLAHDDA